MPRDLFPSCSREWALTRWSSGSSDVSERPSQTSSNVLRIKPIYRIQLDDTVLEIKVVYTMYTKMMSKQIHVFKKLTAEIRSIFHNDIGLKKNVGQPGPWGSD